MGKASKAKVEVSEVQQLLEILQVLKDVADIRFHSLLAEKDHFQRFGESFQEFFRLLSFTEVIHPLVENDNKKVALLIISTEDSFTGDLHNKVVDRAQREAEKHEDCEFIVVGKKAASKLESSKIKTAKKFEEIDEFGIYEMTLMVKEHVIDQVMAGEYGTVYIIYPWPKDFNTLRARSLKLLPCQNMIQGQKRMGKEIEKVIEESDPIDTLAYLADLWLTSRIYEIMYDMKVASAAAQSQQLDNSLDKMKKESAVTKLNYRKARKADIDTSLRETFTARMMTT